jgi:hypothetical protein
MRTPTAREALVVLRVTDPRHYAPLVPKDLPTEAVKARQAFDLDVEMAKAASLGDMRQPKGAAGVRLRARFVAHISDDLLREFALEILGAKRCSVKYLAALRVVLGNQAEAQRKGYKLEMNLRVSFAPERVMRTIIDQMQAAGITRGAVVGLGEGRSQVVQCFDNLKRATYLGDNTSSAVAAEALECHDRAQEAKDDARRDAAIASGTPQAPAGLPAAVAEADVPH